MPDVNLIGKTIVINYSTQEVINMVEFDGAIIKPMRFNVVITPINRRGLQRSKVEAMATIEALKQGKLINNLQLYNSTAVGIWTFIVPIEHLRRVEKTLQRKHIPYRKFPNIQEVNP